MLSISAVGRWVRGLSDALVGVKLVFMFVNPIEFRSFQGMNYS